MHDFHGLVKSIHDKDQYVNSLKPKFTTTNLLTKKDGKSEIVSLCRQLGSGVKNGHLKLKDVTTNLINEKLALSLNNIPDPDVAIYLGDVCGSFGLLPWQIRLTEFFSFGKASTVNVEKFITILKKYAKSEQRFGK